MIFFDASKTTIACILCAVGIFSSIKYRRTFFVKLALNAILSPGFLGRNVKTGFN